MTISNTYICGYLTFSCKKNGFFDLQWATGMSDSEKPTASTVSKRQWNANKELGSTSRLKYPIEQQRKSVLMELKQEVEPSRCLTFSLQGI